MARWKRTLARMLSDSSPTTYTYADATSILRRLGFELAPNAGGSHRKWRKSGGPGPPIVLGLVDKGSGCLKPYLIRDMISQLTEHGLIPVELEQEDDLDD